jgi:hypothetical protein
MNGTSIDSTLEYRITTPTSARTVQDRQQNGQRPATSNWVGNLPNSIKIDNFF